MSGTAAQQHYYWADGKKNVIESDSTVIVIMSQNIEQVKAITMLTDDKVEHYDGFSVVRMATREQWKMLEGNKIDIATAYRIDSVPLIVTNVISLRPRNEMDEIEKAFDQQIRFKDMTTSGVYHYFVSDFLQTLKVANAIEESGLVIWCQPDFLVEFKPATIDPLYNDQYYLNNTGQTGGTPNIDINAPEAWTISTGCYTTRVAVLDYGVEPHQDFGSRYLSGFTALNPLGTGLPQSNQYHGEAAAGIIAAGHNNYEIAGISPNSFVIPVNGFLGLTSVSYAAAAIRAAWDPTMGNADILSNSWNWGNAPSLSEITDEINFARTLGRGGKGAIVVFSSGNSYGPVLFPANVPGVVTVGAINKNGALWNYSGHGPEMDLVAPSGNGAGDSDIVTLDLEGLNGQNGTNYLTNFNGTSASAPQVAGVAALILSLRPELTEAQVRDVLTTSATDMGTIGFDNNFGFGRVNAFKALQSLFPISGPDLLCSTSSFTVSNIPGGANVTWQATPSNFFTVSSGSGITASPTRYGTTKGQARVTFTVNASCGVFYVYKDFWVGAPDASGTTLIYPSGLRGTNPVNLNSAATYQFNADPVNGFPTSWTWILPSGFSYFCCSTSAYPKITTSATSGSYYLYCRANNACGFSYTSNLNIILGSGGGGNPLRTISDPASSDSVKVVVEPEFETNVPFPNPANSSFDIFVEDPSIILLVASDGRQLMQIQAEGLVQIQVDKLSNGIYFLSISNEKRTVRQKVVVQH